jgi:hypothetical protein
MHYVKRTYLDSVLIWPTHNLDRRGLASRVNLLPTYKFALASRRRKLSLAACTWRIFSSVV